MNTGLFFGSASKCTLSVSILLCLKQHSHSILVIPSVQVARADSPADDGTTAVGLQPEFARSLFQLHVCMCVSAVA